VVYGPQTITSVTFLRGKNTPYGSDDDEANPSPWPSASLIYASIKQLYYSNTLANDPEPFIVIDNQGRIVEGSLTANVNSRYDNFLQSGLGPIKSFPTGANDIIAVGIIPQSLFGDALKSGAPGDVAVNSCFDDGYGNIFKGSTSQYIGNVIYSHGMIIITNPNEANSFIGKGNVSFNPTRTVYETQYKCTIRPDEFNYSLNPTLISGSEYTNPVNSNGQCVNVSGDVESFVTGSTFSPYITAVGLYNSNNELLAVGKLSRPIPTSRTVDMNIVINMDK